MNEYDRQMAQLRELIRPPHRPRLPVVVFVDLDGTTTATEDGTTRRISPEELAAMEADPRISIIEFAPVDDQTSA